MPCYIPVRPTRGAVLDTFTIKGHYLFRYWMTKDYVRTPDFVSDGKHIRAGRGVVAVGLLSGVSELIVSNIVCGYLDRYSGKGCSNLRLAIQENVDLYQLWVDNASKEGVMDLNQARYWTRKFPGVKRMVTSSNVKRWLAEKKRRDIVRAIDETPGGQEWLEWQLGRFRSGLWGQ